MADPGATAGETRRRPRVLDLQHDAAEPPSAIATALDRAGAELVVVRIDRNEPVPASLAGADGLIVLGGPMGVSEFNRYPNLRDEPHLIEEAVHNGLPLLGICLGSQLLATVLGAPVTTGDQKEIGWYPVTLEAAAADDRLFGGLPDAFTAFHWHGDVFALPAGAVALARSERTRFQAFRFGTAAYGLLFHLKVTPRQMDAMTAEFSNELVEAGQTVAILRDGATRFGEHLEDLAGVVFGRWATLLDRAG
jgi:GMP synthase (glutamine-hydrolysing)